MTLVRDYSWCPPKKRPLHIFNQNYQGYEVDENEEPQDLSLKTRQRLQESSPCKPSHEIPEVKKVSPVSQKPQLHLICEMPPSRIPSVPLLSEKFVAKVESKQMLMGTEGLRLISEVASRVEEIQTSLPRITAEVIRTPLQSRRVYAPPTPRSPARLALRERGSWSCHPYLPLTVYGLTSAYSFPSSVGITTKEETSESFRPRSGSASPPEENSTEISSSGSEGSPEFRGDRLSCPDCGRGYATVAGLSRHQQFHCLKDANRTFECKHCPKTYTSMGALKMHIRTHTLPCKCHVCGKAFSRPWLLQGHIRTHTGEKPFECQQCHRSFADRSNLRAHLQTHADVKKYACASCPKTFSRMSLLLKHQDHGCPGVVRPRPFSISTSPIAPL